MATDCRADLQLEPDPNSVGRARRHVADALRGAGLQDWVDDAQSAVSELVTNVVLHARTACTVHVEVSPEGVRVGVRDDSPELPTERHFSTWSTTGRGLGLVASLATEVGVDQLPDRGKVVWFVLAGEPDSPRQEQLTEWDLSDLLPTDSDTADRVAVLPDVPTALWRAALEHHAAVLRELYLLSATSSGSGIDDVVDLPAADEALRLLTAASERAFAAAPVPAGDSTARAAAPTTADVPIQLGATSVEVFGRFQDALDLGVQLAHRNKLLLRPPLPEVVSLRDWMCDQVVAQSTGVSATPWDAAQFAGPVSTPTSQAWDDTAVRTATVPVVAADDSNRIIAVSLAAADLLGTTADDLIGSRVTSIVPVRLRELHVVGFTRHLTTGHSRIIGVPIDLPFLRRDGVEVMLRLLLEALPRVGGRHIYLGHLEPLPDGATTG